MKKWIWILLVFPVALLSFRLGQESVYTPAPQQSLDFSAANDVWATIENNYLRVDELDPEVLKYGLAKGVVDSLDDVHSVYMTPDETAAFMSSLHGDLEGIGAELRLVDGEVVVVSPIPNSPAQRAGVLPGDIIIKVDGKALGIVENLYDAVMKIRGPKGTQVTLTVLREKNFQQEELVITREAIHVESVEYQILEEAGESIAHVNLASFTEDVANEFKKVFEELQEQGVKKVVLDLRFNGGGFLNAAVDIISYLTDAEKPVVYIKDRNGTNSRDTSDLGVRFDMDLVVLVNGSSASASEIVAGALQDYALGHIIGTQTFGKGSVQEIHPFHDQSALRITIAEWLTPAKRSIEGVGLEPDEVVEMDFEEFLQGNDQQLRAAINYLLR